MTPHPQPEQLGAYLDGELDASARLAVEAHVRECAECAVHLEDLGAVDQAARELPVEAPAGYFEDFAPRVRARLERSGPKRAWRPPVWGWAAAAALLLAVVTPLALQQQSSPTAVRAPEAPAAAEPEARQAERLPQRAQAPPPPAVAANEGQAPPASLAYDHDLSRAPATQPSVTTLLPRARVVGADEPKKNEPLADRMLRATERRDQARPPAEQAQGGAGLELSGRLEPAAPPPPDAQATVQTAPAGSRQNEADEVAKLAQAKPDHEEGRDSRAGFAAAPGLRKRQVPPPASADAPRAKSAVEAKDKETADTAGEKYEDATAAAGVLQESVDVTSQAKRLELGLAAARFRSLEEEKPPRSDREARRLRESWRAFAAENPDHPTADEARVRALEAGALAYRLGRRVADLEIVERDARAYLERKPAPQAERVKRVLEGLLRERR